MKKISHYIIGCLVLAVTSLLLANSASAASLRQITNFGYNPSNLLMHLYVPDKIQNKVPVLLAIHYCTGSGQTYFQNTKYKTLADQYGFIVIYPTATRSSQCFDVYSSAALTRDGGSDPVSMRSMISYVQNNYNVDNNRIFVTGSSSGAMATNVMLALYPDVFRAGAAFAGVPYGCFATTGGSEWNSECSGGRVIKSAQQWGDMVRNAYPGYSGPHPRMQVWHGTSDQTLNYNNFSEEIKQWTNVNGLSQTATYRDTPSSGATRTRYGDTGKTAPVEAISLQGVTHNLPLNEAEAIRFFNLDNSSSEPTPTPTPGNGSNTITVRMRGVTGEEKVNLEVGGTVVQTWTITTSMASYTASTDLSGEIRVAFINDAGDRDVQVDYISINGEVRQAEDQDDNTGAWGNDTCGGGTRTEMLHCNGSIGFGSTGASSSSSSSSSSSGGCNGGSSSSSASSSSSSSGGCGN